MRYTIKLSQKIAFWAAVIYFLLSLAYIWISTYLAGHLASDLVSLQAIEWGKGTLFMIINAGVLGCLFGMVLEKLHQRGEQLAELEDQLVVLDRRALIGTFSSAVAHDMRNLLTGIKSCLSLVETSSGADSKRTLSLVEEGVNELIELTGRMMTAGRDESKGRLKLVKPEDELMYVINIVSKHPLTAGMKIESSFECDGGLIKIDPALVKQMLINLMLNAAEAAGPNGMVRVEVIKNGPELMVKVHDSGPGVPESEKPHVLKAYASQKEGGIGLGLLSVKTCAAFHNGHVAIKNSPIGGALFIVTLQGC